MGPVASECRFCPPGRGVVVNGQCAVCGKPQSGYRFAGKRRKDPKKRAEQRENALRKAANDALRAQQAACAHTKTDEGRESWLRGQRQMVRTCMACGKPVVTVEEEVSE